MVYSRHTKLRILQLYLCISLALSHNKLNESITSQLSLTLKKSLSILQDNDPKHTSRLARAFFEDNGVHWWKTTANPIENRWNELKEYMRKDVKPHNKDKLVNGIAEFARLWTRRSAKNIT